MVMRMLLAILLAAACATGYWALEHQADVQRYLGLVGFETQSATSAVDYTRNSADLNVASKLQSTIKRYPAMPDFPAVAMLMKPVQGFGYMAHCSGTLVASNVVLTAAHCLCDPKRFKTSAQCEAERSRLDDVSRADDDVMKVSTWKVFFQHSGVYGVTDFRIFAGSSSFGGYDISREKGSAEVLPTSGDLGLLVLDRPVENVRPVILAGASWQPVPSTTPDSVNSITVGFGLGKEKTVGIKVHSFPFARRCVNENATFALCSSWKSPSNQVTADQQPGGSLCSGDSGGALFTYDENISQGNSQDFRLWGVNSAVSDFSCSDTQTTTSRFMDLSFGPYSDWVNKGIADAKTSAAASAPPTSPSVSDQLNPVFNDDTRYLMRSESIRLSVGNNVRQIALSGIFERGLNRPEDSVESELVFQVVDEANVRIVLNTSTAVSRDAAVPVVSLALTKLKLLGDGLVGAPEIPVGPVVSNSGDAATRLPVLNSGIRPVTPGWYRVRIVRNPGIAVQAVVTGYSG